MLSVSVRLKNRRMTIEIKQTIHKV